MPVLYWGRSLGVAMASYAATVRAPDGLILESGFPDALSLIRGSPLLASLARFSTYRFPAAAFLGRLRTRVPTLVVHGDDDHVVPIAQGRALFDAVRGPGRFVTIHGGDHNDAAPSDPTTSASSSRVSRSRQRRDERGVQRLGATRVQRLAALCESRSATDAVRNASTTAGSKCVPRPSAITFSASSCDIAG